MKYVITLTGLANLKARWYQMLSRMWNKEEVGEGGVNWCKYFDNTDVSNLIWKCVTRQPSIPSLGICPRECICPPACIIGHMLQRMLNVALLTIPKRKKKTWNIQIYINSGIDKEIAVNSHNRILYSTHIQRINLGEIFKIFNNCTA